MDKSISETTEKLSDLKIRPKKPTSKEARKRPKSVSKYAITLSDHNSSSKGQKKHSNSSIIEKILKKSLLKAKNFKLTQTKELKLKNLKEEIRKNELEYQNKKIRLTNCSSTKNKRARSKERHLKTQENNMNSILRADISPPPKKSDQSFFTTLKKQKKIISERKPKKKSQRSNEKPKKKGKKSENLEFLASFKSRESSSSEHSSEIFKSNMLERVNRNISFIQDSRREESLEKIQNEKIIENDFKFTETEDDRKSTDIAYKLKVSNLKSPVFYSEKQDFPFLEIDRLESMNFFNKKSRNLEVHTSPVLQVSRNKKILQINKENTFSINPKQKKSSAAQSESNLRLITQSSYSISAKTRTLKQSKTSSIKLKPSPNPLNLENFSWNLAVLFLLDQLHLYEISDFSELVPNMSTTVLKKIGKKYSGIKSFLQKSFEDFSNKVLENLSFEQHTDFIQKTHTKKLEIQKVLTGIFEGNLEPNEEESKSQISHSQSLQFLHEDSPEKKEKKIDHLVSFGFEVQEDKENNCVISISDEESMGKIMDGADLKKLIEAVYKVLDWDFIRNELRKPLVKDPLAELDRLQETQIGSPIATEIYKYPELFDVCETMTRLDDNEKLQDFEKVHRKMILYALNASLQQFRPFGYKGSPLPWSQKIGIEVKINQIQDIQNKVLRELALISSFEIGSIVEIDANMSKPSESQLIKVKERQLDRILFFEAILDEYKWTDYDFEESQVKIDLADMILQDLALELIKIVD